MGKETEVKSEFMGGITRVGCFVIAALLCIPIFVIVAFVKSEPVHEDQVPGISVTKTEHNGELVNVKIHFWNTRKGTLTLDNLEQLRLYKGRVRALLSDLEDIEKKFPEPIPQ